jgi:hypothetical protein
MHKQTLTEALGVHRCYAYNHQMCTYSSTCDALVMALPSATILKLITSTLAEFDSAARLSSGNMFCYQVDALSSAEIVSIAAGLSSWSQAAWTLQVRPAKA